MVKSLILFACSIQLLLVRSQIKDFECIPQPGDDEYSTRMQWETLSGTPQGVDFRHGISIKITKESDERIGELKYVFIKNSDGGFWSTEEVFKKSIYDCKRMTSEINNALSDPSVIKIKIGPYTIKDIPIQKKQKIKPKSKPHGSAKIKLKPPKKTKIKPKPHDIRRSASEIQTVSVTPNPATGEVTFKFIDIDGTSRELYSETVTIGSTTYKYKKYHATGEIKWTWKNPVTDFEHDESTDDLKHEINDNLGKEIIKIGPYIVQEKRQDLVALKSKIKMKERERIRGHAILHKSSPILHTHSKWGGKIQVDSVENPTNIYDSASPPNPIFIAIENLPTGLSHCFGNAQDDRDNYIYQHVKELTYLKTVDGESYKEVEIVLNKDGIFNKLFDTEKEGVFVEKSTKNALQAIPTRPDAEVDRICI